MAAASEQGLIDPATRATNSGPGSNVSAKFVPLIVVVMVSIV
jgi:hypothetical protein